MRNDEMNIFRLTRERAETGEFEGRVTRECCRMTYIKDRHQHELPTRRAAVLREQDMVTPLRPTRGLELIPCKGTR
jgi:hypothetical protein